MKSHLIREDFSLNDARERGLQGFRILLYKTCNFASRQSDERCFYFVEGQDKFS